MTSRHLASLVLALGLAGCSHPSPAASPTPPAPPPGPAAAASPTAAAATPFHVEVSGHGPDMILIPGMASSGEVWNSTVAHERERFTCHVLTLPGFAGQPRIAAPMLTTVRDAIAAYITSSGLDRPIIVGHSLGGFIALDLAATRPELVGPLVIVDALPFLAAVRDPSATAASVQASAAGIRAGMSAGTPESRREQQRGMLSTMVTDPANLATVVDWGTRSDHTAVVDAMVEMLTSDLRPRLAAIKAPTLVIGTWTGYPGATHDSVAQVFTQQYASLRGAEIVLADHARHFVMLDDPAFLFTQLDGFLGRSLAAR